VIAITPSELKLLKKIKELKAAEQLTRLLYNELIMEVATKIPGESRHNTAKRYITERENRMNDNNTAQEQRE
jgi:hypothetical protein